MATSVGKATAVDLDNVSLTQQNHTSASKKKIIKFVLTIAVIACVGVALMVAVLQFSSTKSSGVTLPDRFVASYTMHRLDNTDFTYEGRVHKEADDEEGNWRVEAQVSYFDPNSNITTRFTLHDRRAYYEEFRQGEATPFKSGCFPVMLIPPIADIDDVLRNAAEVPEEAQPFVSGECPDGRPRYALQWGTDPGDGENTLYYCDDGNVHVVSGANFVANVWDVDTTPATNPLALTVPLSVATGEPLSCPEMPRNITALSDAVGVNIDASRRLNQPNGRRLPGADRDCWFVHSFGNDDSKKTSSSWSAYWGSVEDSVGDACDKTKFIKLDFKDAGWDDPSVLNDLCDELADGHNGDSITDKIIFTHGYSSLALATAMWSSVCTKGNDVDWYSVAAPWEGAEACDEATSLCANQHPTLDGVFEDLGMCVSDTSSSAASASCASLKTTYSSAIVSFSSLKTYAMTQLSGAMCGYTSYGSDDEMEDLDDHVDFSGESVAADASNWEQAAAYLTDDGFVHVNTCKGGQTFGGKYTDQNAALFVNHLTATCRGGDPVLDLLKTSSPCKWYKYRTTL